MPSTVDRIESYKWLYWVFWFVQPDEIDIQRALSPEFLASCKIFINSSCLYGYAVTCLGRVGDWLEHATAFPCPSGNL